jgi:hypothetical protein
LEHTTEKTGYPWGDEVKAELLFIAAFDRVSATQSTYEFLWDNAVAFAEAFSGDESDERFPIYSRLFCTRFRPGFEATPGELMAEAEALSVPAIAKLRECRGSTPERLESNAQAEAEAAARKAAIFADRQAFIAKKEAEAKAKADADKQANELLQPATLESVLVKDLDIHGFAKKAFKNAGIDTVGEVLTYKAARPLADIKGIGEELEVKILEAIEKLRPAYAKSNEAPAE